MLRDLRNNQGVVFVTVLIIIIVAMILAISVLSLNISQVKSAEDELKSIQAGILSEGILAQVIVNQFSASPSDTFTYQETLDNTDFVVTADIDRSATGPIGYDVAPLIIDVTF